MRTSSRTCRMMIEFEKGTDRSSARGSHDNEHHDDLRCSRYRIRTIDAQVKGIGTAEPVSSVRREEDRGEDGERCGAVKIHEVLGHLLTDDQHKQGNEPEPPVEAVNDAARQV